jgi:hypothetical protein
MVARDAGECGHSQRSKVSLSAAPAAAASRVSGMMTIFSAGRPVKYSGLSRLCGVIEIFPSDLLARHQSMFL